MKITQQAQAQGRCFGSPARPMRSTENLGIFNSWHGAGNLGPTVALNRAQEIKRALVIQDEQEDINMYEICSMPCVCHVYVIVCKHNN